MEIRPLKDKVVIKLEEKKENKTDSGIIIPESATQERRAPNKGTVTAVGPDVSDVKVGDRVLFQTSLTEKFDTTCIIQETLIIGIIDD